VFLAEIHFYNVKTEQHRPKHNKHHYANVLEKMKTRNCTGKREKIGFRMSGPTFILPCSAIKCSIIWK